MTIASETSRVNLVGNGVNDTFTFTFEIYVKTDLLVYVENVLQEVDVNYTIADEAIENPDGGDIVFGAEYIPALDSVVSIILNLPYTQLIDYVETDKFPAETHERGLDRLVKIAQRLKEELSRTPSLIISSALSDLIIPEAASRAIGWNSDATELTTYPTTPINRANIDSLDDDYSGSLVDMVAGIGANKKSVLIDTAGSLTAGLEIPDNIHLIWLQGCVWDGAYTLAIKAHLEAGPYQLFGASITVTFGAGTVKEGYAEWWDVDGTADEVQINKAITALSTVAPIQLLGRKYTIADSIVPLSYMHLYGVGYNTEIYLADNSDCNMIENGAAGRNHIKIRDLRLNGNKDNQASGHGIAFDEVYYSEISDCWIEYIKQDGIHLGDTSTTTIPMLRNTIRYCDRYGIYGYAAYGNHIENCIFEYIANHSIYGYGYHNAKISGNYFEDNSAQELYGMFHFCDVRTNYFNSTSSDPVVELTNISENNQFHNNRVTKDVVFVEFTSVSQHHNIIGQNYVATPSKIVGRALYVNQNNNSVLYRLNELQGYENLVRRGSFEEWGQGTSAAPDSWLVTDFDTSNILVTRQSAENNYGKYCAKLMFDAEDDCNSTFSTTIPLLHPSTVYSISFRYKCNTDVLHSVVLVNAPGAGGGIGSVLLHLTADEAWYEFQHSFTTPAENDLDILQFKVTGAVTTTDYLMLDNVVLQRGHNTFPEIVHTLDKNQTVKTVVLDLSGAAATDIILHREEACTLCKATFLYTEASSADAGIALKIGKETDDDYYYTGTSETGKAQWYSVDLTLLKVDVGAGDSVIFSSAGGKAGTGEIILTLEYFVDFN